MAKKKYDWIVNGVILEDHTKKKHDILREYLREYLLTRCKIPQQEKFRLVIVDAFAGGGLYQNGESGSPLIFIQTLIATVGEINTKRAEQGMKQVRIECVLFFVEELEEVIEQLESNLTPLLLRAESIPNLEITTRFFGEKFENIYPQIKGWLLQARIRNVLFNLDQCGYASVSLSTLRDIMHSWSNAEALLTFSIQAMLSYLSPDMKANRSKLDPQIKRQVYSLLDSGDDPAINKKEWLGYAEKIIYDALRDCGRYVSPFSVNNEAGWRYWLMHFSNAYRARQVFNDILHKHAGAQAHYGRAGLDMLGYDSLGGKCLYVFDDDSRTLSREQLYEDIPRELSKSGDAIRMNDFYEEFYSETPAHSQDIHAMMIENPDINVLTEGGGKRRKANTIKSTDILRLNPQRSLVILPTFRPKTRD